MRKAEIQANALAILSEYHDQDIVMTLRQLYYQFVARGLLGSGQQVYNRVGSATRDARLDGTIPIDWIEDRGRHVGSTRTQCFDDVDDAMQRAASEISVLPLRHLQYGRWYAQQTKVFVWIEKEALAGVLEDRCERLGVGLFPCKGYPSVSSISAWVTETYNALEEGDSATVIYLGDHDPDGIQIPRSAHSMIAQVQRVKDEHFKYEIDVVALTMAQINAHNPPPFPARVTSPRYQRYVDETGTQDAWELDALDPITLRTLIDSEVDRHFDRAIYADNRADITERRREMVDRMTNAGWMDAALENLVS